MKIRSDILTPGTCQVIFIDHQPQMAFSVSSIDLQLMKNNVILLAKAAKLFGVPETITSLDSDAFSGCLQPELLEIFPDTEILERTSMNAWDDQNVRTVLRHSKRRKIVVSGLWTEVSNTMFALSAIEEGDYEIYMVADASGGMSCDAHRYAIERMVQAGVIPVTTIQVALELQRDWARRDTYEGLTAILRDHAGAYGIGLDYAVTHVHGGEPRHRGGIRRGPMTAPLSEVD